MDLKKPIIILSLILIITGLSLSSVSAYQLKYTGTKRLCQSFDVKVTYYNNQGQLKTETFIDECYSTRNPNENWNIPDRYKYADFIISAEPWGIPKKAEVTVVCWDGTNDINVDLSVSSIISRNGCRLSVSTQTPLKSASAEGGAGNTLG